MITVLFSQKDDLIIVSIFMDGFVQQTSAKLSAFSLLLLHKLYNGTVMTKIRGMFVSSLSNET